MASVISVRTFEALSVAMWLYGIIWVVCKRTPVRLGVYFGASTLMTFDWVFNSNWFFRVTYDPKFIALWQLAGVAQPLAIACNYAFFFGMPVLLLVERRAWLDRRLGPSGYAAVFVLGVALEPLADLPAVRLGLWTYYQAPEFMVCGVPWSIFWFSGLLTVTCYAAVRLATRWAALELPDAPKEASRETFWRGFLLGAGAIWSAFYVCLNLQLFWYALARPWIPGPRPF